MAVSVLKLAYEGEALCSPFSGKPAETQKGPNTRDQSLLFIHCGDSGEYSHLSKRAVAAFKAVKNSEPDTLAPLALAKKLDLPLVVVFQVDSGWNGVNTYAFAPLAE